MAKRHAKIGDELWEVEWCSNIPKDEYGDSDHDNADFHFARYTTKEKALERARKELPNDAYGSVSVTRIRFVPYDEDDAETMPNVGFWEDAEDAIHIDELEVNNAQPN